VQLVYQALTAAQAPPVQQELPVPKAQLASQAPSALMAPLAQQAQQAQQVLVRQAPPE
jgi:hypothetical protein